MLSVLLGGQSGPWHLTLCVTDVGRRWLPSTLHQKCSVELPKPPTRATKGGTEATTICEGNKGAIHSIPAGAEHVHSSAGLQLPGQPCQSRRCQVVYCSLFGKPKSQTDGCLWPRSYYCSKAGHLEGFVRTWTSAVHRRELQLNGYYSQIGGSCSLIYFISPVVCRGCFLW